MKNLFTGYTEFEIKTDALLDKWRDVRKRLDVDMSVPLMPVDIMQFNLDINRLIKYAAEPSGADYWQAPSVTLATLHGDCEDAAILKYAVLLKSGMEEDDLRISLGQIKSLAGNQDHAWLAVWLDNAWHVLDNKFDHLITPDYYITHGNWLPLAAVWGDQCVRFSRPVVIAQQVNNAAG